MLERIKHILQSRQLTPTQFADAIGVARPIISHILSGRNKPSLEVVQKIIAAFPDLSLPWLLSGTEPMMAVSVASVGALAAKVAAPTEMETEALQAPVKVPKPTVAAPPPAAEQDATPTQEPIAQPQPAPSIIPVVAAPVASVAPPVVAPAAPEPLPVTAPSPTIAAPVPAAAAAFTSPLAAFLEPGKKIKRIVIFYQDGTFGDYQPEQ